MPVNLQKVVPRRHELADQERELLLVGCAELSIRSRQQCRKAGGGLLSRSLLDQALFGSRAKPHRGAVLRASCHPDSDHHRIQTAETTTDDDTHHLLVPVVPDTHGHHRLPSLSEHCDDALHGIAERQRDDEVDLINVLPHQLGHKPGQATAQCGKRISQNLVLALVHTPRPSPPDLSTESATRW